MKYFLSISIGAVLAFLISFGAYSCASWGFQSAIELAVKDRIISYKGNIYSVTDSGVKYNTGGNND